MMIMILVVPVMMMIMIILVGGSELRLLFFVILGVIIEAPNFSAILSAVLLALAVDAPIPLLIGVSGDELGFSVLKTTMNCK
jgi:hypothetical protein